MKINNTQKIITVIFTLVFSQIVSAQQNESWVKLQNSGMEFSALTPAVYLVDKVSKNETEIHAFENKTVITIEVEKTGKAKNRLAEMRNFPSQTKNNVSPFKFGDFSGDIYTYNSEKSFSMGFYIAAPKAYYKIWASAESEDNETLKKFLYSIKLGNQPLVKQDKPLNIETINGIDIESLNVSPVIFEALNRKNTEKGKVTFADEPEEKTTPEAVVNYSRPLIILRKKYPSYSDADRNDGVNGNVRLKVTFKANGQIGDIIVLNKLGKALHNQAVDVAQKMIFLPAEIDGKPVDTTKVVVYNFLTY